MYSREWDSPNRGVFSLSLTPWVRRLLVANAVVYLLTLTVFTGRWFGELFWFSPGFALEQPWTFVTYMFVHGGFLHLAFNMLMLFFFGPAVEEQMGGAAFARYYFLCGLGGAAFSFLLNLVWPVQPFFGASAAVFGVSLAFALHWPDTRIWVFPLPVPIKAKWLVLGLATIDLSLAVFRANDGVAHLAHLGGFLFGLAYLKGVPMMADRVGQRQRQREAVQVLVHPSAEATENGDEPETSAPGKRDWVDAVDRVLDKISATGIDSLSPEERQLLDDMSRDLRNN